MKKRIFVLVLLLLYCLSLTAQENQTKIENTQKWKIRLRAINVITPSSSYIIEGADVVVTKAIMPEVNFTYYFSKNWAAELILATTNHTVKLESGGVSANLGKVWLLPPTLSLQYHFSGQKLTPYIGAGINYSFFYGVKDELASVSYKNNAGFSVQFGMDYMINEKWFLNFDVKKILLKTDVTDKTDYSVYSGVKVDPWIIGLGIGTKF